MDTESGIYFNDTQEDAQLGVLNDIQIERVRQSLLHGEQKDLSLEMLFVILLEEVGEISQAIQSHYSLSNVKETDQDNLYQELIHVAAVAVKIAERVRTNEI